MADSLTTREIMLAPGEPILRACDRPLEMTSWSAVPGFAHYQEATYGASHFLRCRPGATEHFPHVITPIVFCDEGTMAPVWIRFTPFLYDERVVTIPLATFQALVAMARENPSFQVRVKHLTVTA